MAHHYTKLPKRAGGSGVSPEVRWRDLRWKVLCLRERLTAIQLKHVDESLDLHPKLALAYGLLQRFRLMLRQRRDKDLYQWLDAGARSGRRPFQRLARTTSRDLGDVREAVQSPRSTGPVEGHIHRLKLLKRMGYGPAQVPQLRARLIGE